MITQDNNYKKIAPAELEDLKLLAGRTIGKLTEEQFPGLLVFPRDFSQSDDLDENSTIYSIEIKDREWHLVTNNMVGFIGFENTQLTIRSRFADENDEDYFLHYMLQKVLALNVMELKHKSADEQILDFLIYLFPSLLKRAIRQGIFKEYQNRAYDDANIKGRINVSKFIQKDIPFAGHIAYHTREYSADNSLNQLIRHTIEYIKTKPFGNELLAADEETKQAVGLMVAHTPSYSQRDRLRVIYKNLKALRHPYYSSYLPLQRLCVQILRHQGLKYGQNNEKIQGILFDAAWLWEEYLHKILRPLGYRHPQNKKRKGAVYLCESNKGPRYPDFYKGDIVLDAKYKYDANRDDYHQMITYQYIMNGRVGAFISPNTSFLLDKIGKLNGYGATLFAFHLGIPRHADTYQCFCREMERQEEMLRKYLIKYLADSE